MEEHMEPPPPATPSPIVAELPQGMAIASMVLGIVSVVLFCAWPISIPCAIVGLILGLIAGGKAKRGAARGRGMATAGVITSAIAIVLAVLVIALSIANFMRHDWSQMEPPIQVEMSAPSDTPPQEEVQQIEPGQQNAPSPKTED